MGRCDPEATLDEYGNHGTQFRFRMGDSLEPISAIDVQPAFGRSPFISFIVDLSDNQLTQRHIYIDGTTVCKRDLIADNAKIHLQATPLIILTS